MLLALTGCATPQVRELDQRWPTGLPNAARLVDVPFFPQEQYHCGPAALAMVSGAAGLKLTPDDFTDQVYLPGRQGSLQVEMMVAARRQGLLAYALQPQIENVLREVAAGNPVLVLQNLAFSISPLWHYAVVIGYDRVANTITLHSGVTKELEMSLFAFERTWARGDSWAMVALAPGHIPATAEAGAFVASAAALERVSPQAALAAYRSALSTWPQQQGALLGVGNAAYALGNREHAAAGYAAAVAAHPDFADAWNNLAQVQLEMGHTGEALRSIEHAVALGGPRLDRYRELRAEIAARRAP